MNLCLISLGCNKNLVDSEVMLGKLKDYRLTSDVSNADVIIINTCGFIASAKQESVARILEAARDKKNGALLVVSGCLSARYAKELKDEIKEIDIITGVGEFDKIDEILAKKNTQDSAESKKSAESVESKKNIKTMKSAESTRESKKSKDSTNLKDSTDSTHAKNSTHTLDSTDSTFSKPQTFLIDCEDRVIFGSKIHAYIKISEGCNQKCSFCAIPNIKGKLRSRSVESCVNEVKKLVSMGYQDFSFIAQDSSSYMRDFGEKDALIRLIREVEKIDGIKSGRILYLYPSTTSLDLIACIAESRVFQNYFDMPLQHISDHTLKNMRRGAGKSQIMKLLESMRKISDSFIRTTFLLGHPGESERDFDELCEFVSDFVFDRVNIFAFSSEEGTKAHTMRQKVDSKTTNARINRLDKIIQSQQNKLFKSYEGKVVKAIIDGVSEESELLFSARDMRWDKEIDGEILINENLTHHALESGFYEIKIESYKQSKNDRFLIGKALKKL